MLTRNRSHLGIYDLVDDVMVLDHGITMFYGPRPDAQPFFESLGFRYTEGANVADMLTGVTVPTERKIAPGFEERFPRTARDIREAYKTTRTYKDMLELQDYPQSQVASDNTAAFIAAVSRAKSGSLPKNSPLTVSATAQLRILAKRQFRQVWGDKLTLCLRQANTVIQALIMGSLFYDMPGNSTGLLLRGGVIFFSTVYHACVIRIYAGCVLKLTTLYHLYLPAYSPSKRSKQASKAVPSWRNRKALRFSTRSLLCSLKYSVTFLSCWCKSLSSP